MREAPAVVYLASVVGFFVARADMESASPMLSSLVPQRREQNDVADAGAVGQQHHEAVDADAAAAGGGHAVFEGAHVVGVVVHGFLVAAVLGV